MKYPFVFTLEDYHNASMDYRSRVDGWLEQNGIIPQITRSFRLVSPVLLEVTQYEVVDGTISTEEKWPHRPKLTTQMFKVKNNEFPPSSHA